MPLTPDQQGFFEERRGRLVPLTPEQRAARTRASKQKHDAARAENMVSFRLAPQIKEALDGILEIQNKDAVPALKKSVSQVISEALLVYYNEVKTQSTPE